MLGLQSDHQAQLFALLQVNIPCCIPPVSSTFFFPQEVTSRSSPEIHALLEQAIQNLETPKPGSVMDLSDRVKLLGDLPIVTGAALNSL